MLEMDERRLDYSEQLRPEKDFEVVYAVGTTYSLDMAAMLNATLSLSFGEVANSAMRDNDICLLAAVEKMKGKMTVFCEQGRIKTGEKANPLCILFEDTITQVVVSRTKMRSYFHPKVWVVEYANPSTKETKWRLLVLSRNLTFDTSWDVAVRLDGEVTQSAQEGTKPIVDFLRYLGKQAAGKNAAAQSSIRKMANRLQKVRFEVESRAFDEFEFLPMGPGLQKAEELSLFQSNYDNAIVASPFVSDQGPLEILAQHRTSYGERCGKFALIARDYQLATLNDKTKASYDLYIPDPFLSSVELDNGVSPANYSDLHAKIYFTDTGGDRNLYIGSLNASYNGMHNNIECLVRLHAKKRKMMFDDLMKSFVGTDAKHRGPFLQTDPLALGQLASDEQDSLSETALRKLAKLIEFSSVRVDKIDEGAYAIECEFGTEGLVGEESVEFGVSPYLAPVTKQAIALESGNHQYRFSPLKLKQVSCFFTLYAKDATEAEASCVVKAPWDLFDDEQAPLEERTKNLVALILDNDASALALFIDLAFQSRGSVRNQIVGGAPEDAVWGSGTVLGSGLYERLLVASLEDPQILETASMLINLIPEQYEEERIRGMREMIESFRKAVGANAK